MRIPLLPGRRIKSLLWLVAVAVLLQLFIFVADRFWSNDAVVLQDCSTLKSSGGSSQDISDKPFVGPLEGFKITPPRIYLPKKEDVSTITITENRETSDKIEDIPPEKTTSDNPIIISSTKTGSAESKTNTARDDNVAHIFTTKELSNDKAYVQYDCKQLRKRSKLNGYLNVQQWFGWCGHAVDDLRREPLFPFKPNVIGLLGRFATNVTERRNTGKRIFGYVHPPATGDFVFAISSADGSELWLSTDDDPQNSRKIAYLGEPGNQYAASSQFAEFTSKKSQISEKIRLDKGKAYYVEVLQKQKKNMDHVEVAWQIPGNEKLQIIESQFISQFIDYSAEQAEIKARTTCICKDHPTLPLAFDEFMSRETYDMRDDFHFRVESHLDLHLEVADVLPSCPYKPSYLISRKLKEDEAFAKGYVKILRVYPDDKTDVNMSHDINNHISLGNKKLPKDEALQIVSSYMEALRKRKGERFTLKNIVNIEEKVDPKKGIRYLLELELGDKTKGRSVRLSEYIYKLRENSTDICYPEGFQWKRNVTVSMVVTVKNYGPWIKFLINQLAVIYKRGYDRNFFLVIVDFNSSDVDIFKLREKSGIKDRIAIIQQFTEFHKTKALNNGVAYVKDPNSIIFTADLHIRFPANLFNEIRKHTIQGRSFYVPAVLKLKCGYSIAHQQAFWEMMGFGLFGSYKSDWDRFGGMDAEKFTTRWGGEDWDLLDRATGANLEGERLRLPKLYHYYHDRLGDWYESARI